MSETTPPQADEPKARKLVRRRRDATAAAARLDGPDGEAGPSSTTTAAALQAGVLLPSQQTPRKRTVRDRLDTIRDSLAPGALRRKWQALQRKLGITRSGQLAVLAAVTLWLLAYIVAGTAMYLFAYGIVLLLILAYVLAPRRLKLEGVRAGLWPRAQEGDRFTVNVQLTAHRRVSTFILEDRVPERLGTPVRVPITKLSKGSTTEHTYGLRCARRGVYEIGPLVAVAGDPLGLTQRETVVADKFELLVHPRVDLVSDRPLTRHFEDPPIRPPVSRPWPSGMEFYGIREYVRGDDVRKIVWRASARTGKLMVSEAEQGITDHVTIMIDTDRGRHSRDGEGLSESFETAIRAAASVGVRHLRERYHVRIETNAGPLTGHLHGPDKQTMLLDNLSRLTMARAPMSEMLRRMLAAGRKDAHNILITPHLGPTEITQLRLLLDSGVSVLVVALEWNLEQEADTAGKAAALGCQVVGIKPGDNLAAALSREIVGAGRA